MARYEMVVTNQTQEEQKNPVAGNYAETESAVENVGQSVAKGYGMVKKFVAPFVSQLVTAQTSTVSLRTGAEELQERLQFAESIAQRGFGLAESVVIGGLAGGVGGAVFGAVMTIATTVTSYALKARELDLQQREESISLQQLAVRAGGSLSSFSGSRGRNQ